jgi:hypothetical protein
MSATGFVVSVNTDGTFDDTPNADFRGNSFIYVLTDGDSDSTTATINITVAPTEDDPVNAAPGAQTIAEDTDLAIAGLCIGDLDGRNGSVTTTLAVTEGTLTILAAGGAGLSGNGTASVTLTGTIAQVNAALSAANNVVYRGDLDFNGSDQLTITSTDGTSRTTMWCAPRSTTRLSSRLVRLTAPVSSRGQFFARPTAPRRFSRLGHACG